MRFNVYSDLHLECFESGRDLSTTAVDIIILAGDIHSGVEGLEWARGVFPNQTIIYVPGNHEYYGACMPTLRSKFREVAKRLDIHLLDNHVITLDNIRFYGTTLWTDFDLYKQRVGYNATVAEAKAKRVMPDFSEIEQPEGAVLTIAEVKQLHQKAIAWLEVELAKPFDGKRVVISHHAPLEQCIPKQYKGDLLSPVFASNLEHLMGLMDVWIHGHVHEPVDLYVSGTRIFANPGGYPNEFELPLFDNKGTLVI